ncbi:angiopoietin-2-like, partial [Lingula anatina]|uniref:Angiopoietin-2-like n=1 Tax=Lingula anatina TaxID=7574 RepID=A0A1S3H2K1_LINAN
MDSRGSYVLHALFLAGIIQLMSQQGHTQVTSVTFKSTKNAYLPVSALNTVSARSSLECMTLCKQKEGCHSCNYFGDGTGACELNSQVANDVEAVQLSQKEEATYHAALYVDCNDVETTGLLNIDISGFGQKTVYCDNGWLVVLRRTDNQVDFHRTWNEYRDGFGDPRDQFWLGNEALYGLTNQGNYSMQIDMKSCDGNYYYVKWNL